MASWEVWTFGRGCCSIRARAAAPAIWDPLVGAWRLCLAPELLCTTSGLALRRHEGRGVRVQIPVPKRRHERCFETREVEFAGEVPQI
ncbi:hypothetical protein EYF80_023007 [Liparis tanakae]|uniref:Uncharacterized protein n=1 Tax=Liparis tanakae TaxID=230148 RepID=A0A4Z2HN90_9TELE|nr:hypothetical protein EYF80_023007 [Liparis tanakae]